MPYKKHFLLKHRQLLQQCYHSSTSISIILTVLQLVQYSDGNQRIIYVNEVISDDKYFSAIVVKIVTVKFVACMETVHLIKHWLILLECSD